jgi:periplasmic protein CpxP/Spy
MKRSTLALAGALALLTATAGQAQAPRPQDSPQDHPRAHARPDPAQMAEHRAQRLRDTLQLRPEQEPALKAFIEASAPRFDRGARGKEGVRGEAQALTTPERLDRMRAHMAERQAAFERRAEATKRFYAQLSPAQQRAFDATGGGGGREHGRRGHHGGRGFRG